MLIQNANASVTFKPLCTAELVSVGLKQSYRADKAEFTRLSFNFIFPDKKRYCITPRGKVMKLL